MRERAVFLFLLGIDVFVLLLESSGLSISYREARTLYDSYSLLHYIVNGSLNLLGHGDFALRFPMIVAHVLSVVLFYGLSGRYLPREADRLWLVAIFMLLPGINSAALLVDNSSMVILMVLAYAYFYDTQSKSAWVILVLSLGIDVSFAFLYLGLFFYAVYIRNVRVMTGSLLLFGASMYLFGFDTHGAPKGHFLDVLGLYAVIFSPIVFVYLVYVLFRKVVVREFDRLWFLSAVPLFLSLLLSFRQELEIQVFAPFLILSMPLAAQMFFHSYRVRLRPFRKKYRILFGASFVLLLLHALAVFFNKEFYYLLKPGQKHFAYKQHVAKELAAELKASDIPCIDAGDRKMQLRLHFYGIGQCSQYRLFDTEHADAEIVTISYTNRPNYFFYVTKLNKM